MQSDDGEEMHTTIANTSPDGVLLDLHEPSSPQRDVYRFVPWTGVKYPEVPGNTERRQPGETVFRD